MKRALALVALLTTMFPALAQDVKDYGAVPFMNIPTNARWAAMGEAGAVSQVETTSVFDNPASISFSRTKGATGVSFMPWQSNIADKSALAALSGMFRIDDANSVALGIRLLTGPESFTGDNVRLKPYDFDLAFAYARKLTRNVSISATAHYIHSRIGIVDDRRVDADGFAFDIGAFYTQPIYSLDGASWNLGLRVANIGPNLKYQYMMQEEPAGGNALPGKAMFGGSVSMPFSPDHKIVIAGDAGYQFTPTGAIDAGFGAEYTLFDRVSFRAGYRYSQSRDTGYATVGCGLSFSGIRLDAAYWIAPPDTPIRNTMCFSLNIYFK